jgi:hypothetical protein
LPNYARLEVIKALEWCSVLSMDNIHYVESELRNIEEAYENYDCSSFDISFVACAYFLEISSPNSSIPKSVTILC